MSTFMQVGGWGFYLIALQLVGRGYTSLSYSVGHLKWILSNSSSYSFGTQPKRCEMPDLKTRMLFISGAEKRFHLMCFLPQFFRS